MRLNKLLSGAVALAALASASTAAVRDGLISYWPLDIIAEDLSSTPDLVSGNHFTLYNIFDTSAHIDGQRGKALLFNGLDQYAAFTATPEVNSGLPVSKQPQFTVAFWAKGVGTGQNDRRMFSEGSTLNNDPLFNIGTHNAGTDGTVDIFIRDAGVQVNHAHSTAVGLDDAWHHIAWTDDNGAARLYIDGQLDSSYTYGRNSTFIDTTSIGAILRAVPGAYFAGAIDDVAIWDRVLSLEEVQTVRTTGIPTPITPAAPAFTLQPASTNIAVGKFLALTATASGDRPISYQWRKDNQPIQDAISNRLTFSNLQASDSGAYTLFVQNAAGSATSVVAQVTVGAAPPPNLTNGLVAYYPFETVQGTKTPDVINGLDMDLRNLTAADLVPGQKGQAFSFSTARQTLVSRVSATNEFLPINQHESYTISMWVQADGLGQNDWRFFSEGSSTSSDPLFNLGTDAAGANQSIDLFFRQSGWAVVDHLQTVQEPLDGTWRHIVFVQDGGQRAIYFDGVRDDVEIPAKPAGAWRINTTSIGGILRASPSHWITGLIDEVALWTRALSIEEINRVKTEGVPVFTVAPAPLAVRTFAPDYPTVVAGDTVTLRWDVTKDVSVSINQGVGDVTAGTVAGVGSATVTVSQPTTYTLTLTRGQETTNATVTINTLANVAPGWRLLENFETRSVGPLTSQGHWRNPEGIVNVRDLGPNNVVGFDGNGGDLSALALNSLTLREGQRATLFFRAFSPAADVSPIGVNIGLTERPIRFIGDFANNVGPFLRFERFDGEVDITVQARNGIGAPFDYSPVSMEPGKVYNFWIDVFNDTLVNGDRYTVHMAEAGQATRTLIFDQYMSDRDPAGTPDLGAAGPDLIYMHVVANMAAQSASAFLVDDFFLSRDAFVSTVPIPAGTFVQQAEPTTIRITSFSANAGAGSFTLGWDAANGARYNVLKASALDGQWAQVGATVTATGANAAFTDTAASGRMAFYRVTLAP